MIKTTQAAPTRRRTTRLRRQPVADRSYAGSRLAEMVTLEHRLSQEFHQYTQDTPSGAFPSFLEALHCDALNK